MTGVKRVAGLPLLPRLLIAAVIGVGCGLLLPDGGLRVLTTFQSVFSQFIKFLVPLIILGFVIPAIAETGKAGGRMLLLTLGLAYASTLFAGYLSYGVSAGVFPSLLGGGGAVPAEAARVFPVYFSIKIPPVFDVVSSLVLAAIVGLGIVATGAETLYRASVQFKKIVELTLTKAFLPVLPLYILTVLAEITASGRLVSVAGVAVRLALCCLGIDLVILLVQYSAAGLIAGKNPFKTLWNMLPAYLTGWGTCSSAATLPVTFRQVRENGVSEPTANLVVPLCANIHLAGSMANVVAYSAGILAMYGETFSLGAYSHFILMMSIVAVASPGVPGGCVLAAGALVDSILGFTPERYGLMVALYMALDGMGTACNLTGDGAIALIVDAVGGRSSGKQKE